jgi:hypothetical protein
VLHIDRIALASPPLPVISNVHTENFKNTATVQNELRPNIQLRYGDERFAVRSWKL